jgi:hypothetical protein
MKRNLFLVILILLLNGCDKSGSGDESSANPPGNETGKGGSLARFTISRDYLYAVSNEDLKCFNLSNPLLPSYEGSIDLGFGIETIFPRDSVIFIGTTSGMYIYDITVPSYPQKISFYEHIRSCDPVVANEKYAYVTLRSESSRCGRVTNELQIVDIQDLASPAFLKSYPMTSPKGLGLDSNTLFVCDDGLKVYNVTTVQNLILKKHFSIKANDVIPYNDLLIVIGDDGLYQYRYRNDTINLLSRISINQ